MSTRTLHLLRHAKSDWSDVDLLDRDRPLGDKGRKQVKRLVGYASTLSVELVVCSPATRARETLAPLRPVLDCPVTFDEAIYSGGVEGLLNVVASLPDDVRSAMIVGHMPGLALLVDELTGSWSDMPTGALAILVAPGGTWPDLVRRRGGARLDRVVTPKDLRGKDG